jgi:hypothetical protein
VASGKLAKIGNGLCARALAPLISADGAGPWVSELIGLCREQVNLRQGLVTSVNMGRAARRYGPCSAHHAASAVANRLLLPARSPGRLSK